jgi:hypothetical protein
MAAAPPLPSDAPGPPAIPALGLSI